MNMTLLSALMGFDISDWDGIPPEDLLLHPSRVADYPTHVAGPGRSGMHEPGSQHGMTKLAFARSPRRR